MSWRQRLRFPDIAPVARSAAIARLRDGVLVFDTQDRLVDLNPAAEALTGHKAGQALGQPANKILAAWPDLIERQRDLRAGARRAGCRRRRR